MLALEGSLLGRYRLVRRLGAGGMAEVWEAVDETFQRPVAIKVVHEEIADDEEFHKRFIREARLAAKLEHPHILSVSDYGSEGSLTWLTMPLRDGGTLSERLRPTPSRATAIAWLRALASALDFAHARGVIHRDVKPANVLFDGDGNIYLADFGLAKGINSGTRVTVIGSTVGTPAYMSPEQASGTTLDGRTDQYSLALLAFRLLTGHLPVEDCPTPVLLHRRAFQDSPLPSALAPNLGDETDAVFARALSREPSARFATCGEFVAALQRALEKVDSRPRSVVAEEWAETVVVPPKEPSSGRRTPPPLPPMRSGPHVDPPSFGASEHRTGGMAVVRQFRWEWVALVLGLGFLAFALLY